MTARKPGEDDKIDQIDAGWLSPGDDSTVAAGDLPPVGVGGDDGTITEDVTDVDEGTKARLPSAPMADHQAAQVEISATAIHPMPAPVAVEAASEAPTPLHAETPESADPGSPSATPVVVGAAEPLGDQDTWAREAEPVLADPPAAAPDGASARAEPAFAPSAVPVASLPRARPELSTPAVSVPVAAALVAIGVIVAGLFGFVGGRLTARPAPAPARSVESSASALRAPTSEPEEHEPEPTASANGEAKDARQRSMAEALAFAKARDAKLVRGLDELERKLSRHEDLIREHATRQALWELASDARTATRAIELVAAQPGPEGPDLLYRIWTGTPARTDATQLAEDLVYTPEVRAKASAALGLALDLRRVEDCDEARKLVAMAGERGDQRSLRPLGRLAKKTGCGDRKLLDCFPCLREDEAPLTRAIQAVRARRAPPIP